MESDPPPPDNPEIKSDTIPSSSTDADISLVPSNVLDDPISSTSVKDDITVEKPSSVDTDDDLLEMNMSQQPAEKITENVDDLVNDLETLLGGSSDNTIVSDESSVKQDIASEGEVAAVIPEISSMDEQLPESTNAPMGDTELSISNADHSALNSDKACGEKDVNFIENPLVLCDTINVPKSDIIHDTDESNVKDLDVTISIEGESISALKMTADNIEIVLSSDQTVKQKSIEQKESEEIDAPLQDNVIITTNNEPVLIENETLTPTSSSVERTQSEVETVTQCIIEDNITTEGDIEAPISSSVEQTEVERATQGIIEDNITTEGDIEAPISSSVAQAEVETATQGVIAENMTTEDKMEPPLSSSVEQIKEDVAHTEVQEIIEEHITEDEIVPPLSSSVVHSEVDSAVQKIMPENIESMSTEDETEPLISSSVEQSKVEEHEEDVAVQGIIQENSSSSSEHSEEEELVSGSLEHTEVDDAVQGIIFQESITKPLTEDRIEAPISTSVAHSEVEMAVQGIIQESITPDDIRTPVDSSLLSTEVETAVQGIIQENINLVSTADTINQTSISSSSIEQYEAQPNEVEMAVQGIMEGNVAIDTQTLISSSVECSEVEGAVRGIMESVGPEIVQLMATDNDSDDRRQHHEKIEENVCIQDTTSDIVEKPDLESIASGKDEKEHVEEDARPEVVVESVSNEADSHLEQKIINKTEEDTIKTDETSENTLKEVPELVCEVIETQQTVEAEKHPEKHQEIKNLGVFPTKSDDISKCEEKIESTKLEEESHKTPLSISVEDEKEEEPIRITHHRPQITEQETSKGHLKMTITKHSDKMHSILKVFDPNDKQEPAVEEEPIPKLIIKNKQQSSPKTSSKKCYSSPSASSTTVSSDVTVGSLSPLKITLKTVGKSEEPSRRNSPKASIRDDSEPPKQHQSPRITIKPIVKPEVDSEEVQHIISTPKVTIKPVKRPLDVSESEPDEDAPSPKVTIRPVVKPSEVEDDILSCHSPKITIKPIKKSDSEESQSSPRTKCEDHEEIKERIVLKIFNKGAISSKESKKRELPHEEEKSEKLAKIKLKFSKEGGHPHIVSQDEGIRRHTRSEDVQATKQELESSTVSESSEMHRMSRIDGAGGSKDSERHEESSGSHSENPSPMEVVQIPIPAPKRRGRPRKNPLIPRDEAKESPTYTSSPRLEETVSPAPSPAPSPVTSREVTPSRSLEAAPAPSLSEGRPKRSCRGQNVMATLGIKPRKPRGRGRGSKVNMGDRVVTPMVVESFEEKDTTPPSKLDQPQTSEAESTKTLEIEPPKKPGRRRRKTSDLHKDNASDTSSVVSEVISLDDDDHSELKSKVPKIEEPKEIVQEQVQDKAPTAEDLLAMEKRQKIAIRVAKAKETRRINKAKRHQKKIAESEKIHETPENSNIQMTHQASLGSTADDSSITSENKSESFSAVSQDVTNKEKTMTPNKPTTFVQNSPEKQQNSGNPAIEEATNSSGLVDSLVDEETRMSADQGFREALPVKQVLSTEAAPEDSQSSLQSSGTTESGKTGNSGKNSRTRLEVNQELDSNVVTADQLAEYFWDSGGPFMLQEQVSLYLGVTSFKRKYPNIVRRAVDMQERDYLRENGFASEAMCNLGLTAVSSHDIIDIMYKDFQDKYEEYCRHTQEKQAKELLSKQKALSQQNQQLKFFDKTELMEQAIQSTLQWNKEFNKERMEQRKASMDLQTFTVHYPKEKMRRLIKPNVGSYPVALVPGQFTDYYKDLSAMEINNLPLNSLGTGYLESSDSDSSDGDSDSSSSSSSSDYSSDEDCKLCAKHTQTAVKTNIA